MPTKWKVLFSVVFASFLIYLDMTVINVAFPVLRRELDVSLAGAQAILSVYILAMGLSTPFAGYLAERHGAKRTYLAALALFVIGSALGGVAPSLVPMVVARVVQGVGGGLMGPLVTAQLLAAFPKEEHGRALGIFTLLVVVAPAVGPLVGGYLATDETWRWVFWVNVPVGLAGIALSSRLMPPDPPGRRDRLDVRGAVLVTVGVAGALYAASQAAERGWADPVVAVTLVVSLLVLALFVRCELTPTRDPLLDIALFRHRAFWRGNLLGYASVIALYSAEFLLPVYLQGVRAVSPLTAGQIMLPIALSAGVFSVVSGALYDRLGPWLPMVLGFALLLGNSIGMASLDRDTSLAWVAALAAMRGAAVGLTAHAAFASAMSAVPEARLTRGTSLVVATRYLAQALGVAVLASCVGAGVASGEQVATASDLDGIASAYRLTIVWAAIGLAISLGLPGWPRAWKAQAPS